jgi:hypothetical protein
VGTEPGSSDLFIIQEIGTYTAKFIFFNKMLLILSIPQLLLCLRDLIILNISSGDVGVKYILFVIGCLNKYVRGFIPTWGILAASFFPTFEKYLQKPSAISPSSVIEEPFMIKLSEILVLSHVQPIIVFKTFQVFLMYCRPF